MKGKPEAFRLFEEQSFEQNKRTFSPNENQEQEEKKKDHRLTFTIGAFNDGLKTNFCNYILSVNSDHVELKRLITQKDVTTFGISRNQAD